MKFLVLVCALVAVCAATEGGRAKRGVFGYGGFGYGYAAPAVVKGAAAVVSGPSGVITANTGAVAAPAAYGAYAGYGGHGVYGGYAGVPAAVVAPSAYSPGVVAAAPQTAGIVKGPGATLVGPSTDGRPGHIAANGYYGAGYYGGYGAGYYGGYYH